MAKGKHAAAAAARRLREAEQRITELESLRQQEANAAHDREQELKKEIAQLKGQIVAGLDGEVERRLEVIREAHAREVANLQDDFAERVRTILGILGRAIPKTTGVGTPDEWEELTVATGLPVAETMRALDPEVRLTRAARRTPTSAVKRKLSTAGGEVNA